MSNDLKTINSSTSVLLLDIEGTTTSISFVKDVLFPFARKCLEQFLCENWNDAEVQSILKTIKHQYEDDTSQGLFVSNPLETDDKDALLPAIVKYLEWQMDLDKKTTGLKALQGKIWRKGYEEGILKSHVYDDVLEAIERWTKNGNKVYIYSSGSVEAQILLFKYSVAGDITKFLSGYFDTTTGPKIEAQSYLSISQKIGVNPHDILFLTDICKEGYAAKEAGFQVVISVRPGNAPLTDQELQDFITVQDFKNIL